MANGAGDDDVLDPILGFSERFNLPLLSPSTTTTTAQSNYLSPSRAARRKSPHNDVNNKENLMNRETSVSPPFSHSFSSSEEQEEDEEDEDDQCTIPYYSQQQQQQDHQNDMEGDTIDDESTPPSSTRSTHLSPHAHNSRRGTKKGSPTFDRRVNSSRVASSQSDSESLSQQENIILVKQTPTPNSCSPLSQSPRRSPSSSPTASPSFCLFPKKHKSNTTHKKKQEDKVGREKKIAKAIASHLSPDASAKKKPRRLTSPTIHVTNADLRRKPEDDADRSKEDPRARFRASKETSSSKLFTSMSNLKAHAEKKRSITTTTITTNNSHNNRQRLTPMQRFPSLSSTNIFLDDSVDDSHEEKEEIDLLETPPRKPFHTLRNVTSSASSNKVPASTTTTTTTLTKEKKEKATPPIRRRLSLRRTASEILIKKESDKYSQQRIEVKGPSTSATSTRKRKAEDPPSSPSSSSSSSSARFRGAIRDTSKPLMTRFASSPSMIKSRTTPFRHLEVSSPSHDEDEETEENEEDDDISSFGDDHPKKQQQSTHKREEDKPHTTLTLLHNKRKERPSDKGKVLPDIKKPKQQHHLDVSSVPTRLHSSKSMNDVTLSPPPADGTESASERSPTRNSKTSPTKDTPVQEEAKLISDLYSSIQLNAELDIETEQPEHLVVPLLPYQKQGLAWLISRESKTAKPRGGILADAMGLGKTIQILGLILANQSSDSNIKTTLVVCPLSTLDQWVEEIRNRVTPSHLKIHVYYGAQKIKDAHWLQNYDIVLTTYGTLAAEYVAPSKQARNRRGTISCLASISWFRVILDEAQMIKNSATRTAKAAFSLVTANRWCLTGTPIQNSLEDMFSLLHFLKVANFSDRWWWNLMIIKPIHRNNSQGFMRLQNVLSEILLRRTKEHTIDGKQILSLPPCKVIDTMLEFSPTEQAFYATLYENAQSIFDSYLEAGTANSHYIHILELLLRLRQCCDHPLIVLMCTVMRGFKASERSCTNRKPSLAELQKEYDRVVATMKENSGFAFSEASTQDTAVDKEEGDEFIPATPSPRRSSGVLSLDLSSILLLTPTKSLLLDVTRGGEEGNDQDDEGGGGLCVICMNDLEEDAVFNPACNHSYCLICIQDLFKERYGFEEESEAPNGKAGAGGAEGTCPGCNAKLKMRNLKPVGGTKGTKTQRLKEMVKLENTEDSVSYWNELEEDAKRKSAKTKAKEKEKESTMMKEGGFLLSTKVRALVRDLKTIAETDSSTKSLVFSQFTMCLDLIELCLKKERLQFIRLDGSMTKANRVTAIRTFKTSKRINIFLISLKSGNCGLNLTEANRVYIMEPWWNPSVEQQAIDRTHRLGQDKQVTVVRYLMENSIEQRIITLQQKKRDLVEGALSGVHFDSDMGQLSLLDLQQLFQKKST